MKEYPVIIIGMHRSGTSMLTRVLQRAGLFMGEHREENDESLFFLDFNKWVFRQAYSYWDNPYNYQFTNDVFKEHIKRVFKSRINSIFAYKYLGWKKYFKYKSLENLDFKWGWKDPRNSFIVDIYKEIYPKAKILHIYRNPIDVAQSLKTRSQRNEKNFKNSLRTYRNEKLLRANLYYTDSYRMMHIEEGYKLWKEYVKRSLMQENALHIRYEDLLQNPNKNLQKIFAYLEIKVEDKDIVKYSNGFDATRAFSFVDNNELVRFYNKIRNDELLKLLQYDRIIEDLVH